MGVISMHSMDTLEDITFVSIGDKGLYPGFGHKVSIPTLTVKKCAAMYQARFKSISLVKSKYFMVVDDAPDVLLPHFKAGCQELIEKLEEENAAIGSGIELQPHQDPSAPVERRHWHHAVICRTEAFNSIQWPTGCFHFQNLAYQKLKTLGFVETDFEMYKWIPSYQGAATWADNTRGIINAGLWLEGRDQIHFPSDLIVY